MDQNILKDTVPPKNIEAEQAVLGALLLNWSEAIADVVSYLRPDRFYSVQNQIPHMIATSSQSYIHFSYQ